MDYGIMYVIFNVGMLSPPFLQNCESDMCSSFTGNTGGLYLFFLSLPPHFAHRYAMAGYILSLWKLEIAV